MAGGGEDGKWKLAWLLLLGYVRYIRRRVAGEEGGGMESKVG